MTKSLVIVIVTLGVAWTAQPADPVKMVPLPLPLPTVGNVDGVGQWRFGRIEDLEQTPGPDVILRIRTAPRQAVRVTGPGAAIAELAWRSDWVRGAARTFPGRADYAERMVAFDYDESGRLIALMSMEPVNRDKGRLQRALQ